MFDAIVFTSTAVPDLKPIVWDTAYDDEPFAFCRAGNPLGRVSLTGGEG